MLYRLNISCLLAVLIIAVGMSTASAETRYALDVLPAKHETVVDEETGAEVVFITTDSAYDKNLYFHDWSWLADSSLVLFTSQREKGGLMGYLTETGELVRITTPTGGLGGATAAVDRNSVFATRGSDVVEMALEIKASDDPQKKPSTVFATERHIAALPEHHAGALNPNCDGTLLSMGVKPPKEKGPAHILSINIASGEIKTVFTVPEPINFVYHVQWSHSTPHLLSFAAARPRINVVDIRTGTLIQPYLEVDGELVTHEHWWVDDQIAFCGGTHEPPTEDSHVKLVDVHSGQVRILGAGSWWKEGKPSEIAKYNHWHCAGSDDGRWVVSDNWHGDLWLHEGQTARSVLLTQGHRTYGKGAHPEMGWDRNGEKIVFASQKRGNVDVCIVTIPDALQKANITTKRSPEYLKYTTGK